jgi:hypothetical protein
MRQHCHGITFVFVMPKNCNILTTIKNQYFDYLLYNVFVSGNILFAVRRKNWSNWHRLWRFGLNIKKMSGCLLTNEMQLTASFENEYRRHSCFKPLNITFPFDGTDLQHLNKTHIHLVNIQVYLFILLQNITFLSFCWFVYARKCVVASMVATPMVGG